VLRCPLLFVAVKTAVGAIFHTFLMRLGGVTMDEAHLVLASSVKWRSISRCQARIERLLAKRTNINAQGGRYGNALWAALA
jgi:hypothetical protein